MHSRSEGCKVNTCILKHLSKLLTMLFREYVPTENKKMDPTEKKSHFKEIFSTQPIYSYMNYTGWVDKI